MLAVTVRSAIEALKALPPHSGEVIVCDNSDEHIYKLLQSVLPMGYTRDGTLNIIRQPFPGLFTARETAIKAARGTYILCLDSHMLCGHNMIADLVNFMDQHSSDSTIGFAHAPISWCHQHERASRHDRDMSTCELGDWNIHYDEERLITWKGMPWICRRDWFLDHDSGLGGYGALAEFNLAWGGGDMHIGVKPWLLGFRNWAVPCAPGIHIGPFPKVDLNKDKSVKVTQPSDPDSHLRYRLWSASGDSPTCLGFLVSCYVLGGERMMSRNKEHIKRKFSAYLDVDAYWHHAMNLGQGEKEWLDARKVMSFEQLLERRPWNGHGA